MTEEKTVLDQVREIEKDLPPWAYACYRLGHFIGENSRLCLCCLQEIPVDDVSSIRSEP